jgi:uncharacterized protein (TIGR02186 family)
MRGRWLRNWAALLLLLTASAANAQSTPPRLVLDVSQRTVAIQSGFTGQQLLLFGAILYPGGRVPEGSYDMVVEVEGPLRAITVREKQRVAGIWVNADSRDFRSVPGYYGVASTRPLEKMLDRKNAFIYQIGLDNLAFSPIGAIDRDFGRFQSGLTDLKQRQGLYRESPGQVQITEKVLYRARIDLPASVPVGQYKTRAYLVKDGKVVASATGRIRIGKTGFERGIELAAQNYGILYGLLAVFISLALGWLAGWAFRRLQ